MYVRMHVCALTYMCERMYVYVCLYVCVYMFVSMHACMYICIPAMHGYVVCTDVMTLTV